MLKCIGMGFLGGLIAGGPAALATGGGPGGMMPALILGAVTGAILGFVAGLGYALAAQFLVRGVPRPRLAFFIGALAPIVAAVIDRLS